MIERKCKNCPVFDRENSICRVTFIIEGEDYVITTRADDDCHLEKYGITKDIKTVGVWSDGKQGYIEY